jgi:hypothetical protein
MANRTPFPRLLEMLLHSIGDDEKLDHEIFGEILDREGYSGTTALGLNMLAEDVMHLYERRLRQHENHRANLDPQR